MNAASQTRPSVLDLNCSDGFLLPTKLTAVEARILGIRSQYFWKGSAREGGEYISLLEYIV